MLNSGFPYVLNLLTRCLTFSNSWFYVLLLQQSLVLFYSLLSFAYYSIGTRSSSSFPISHFLCTHFLSLNNLSWLSSVACFNYPNTVRGYFVLGRWRRWREANWSPGFQLTDCLPCVLWANLFFLCSNDLLPKVWNNRFTTHARWLYSSGGVVSTFVHLQSQCLGLGSCGLRCYSSSWQFVDYRRVTVPSRDKSFVERAFASLLLSTTYPSWYRPHEMRSLLGPDFDRGSSGGKTTTKQTTNKLWTKRRQTKTWKVFDEAFVVLILHWRGCLESAGIQMWLPGKRDQPRVTRMVKRLSMKIWPKRDEERATCRCRHVVMALCWQESKIHASVRRMWRTCVPLQGWNEKYSGHSNEKFLHLFIFVSGVCFESAAHPSCAPPIEVRLPTLSNQATIKTQSKRQIWWRDAFRNCHEERFARTQQFPREFYLVYDSY